MSKVPSIELDFKILTVNPAGTPGVDCDYTTLADAVERLRQFAGERGGILALEGGQNHDVDTVVDLSGLTIQSRGDGKANIRKTGDGGFLICDGTYFEAINFFVNDPGLTAPAFFLDFQSTSAADFVACDFYPGTDPLLNPHYIVGTSLLGPFGVTLVMRYCGQPLQDSEIIDPAANFDFAITFIIIIGTSGLGVLQFGNWPITGVDPQGRMDTTSSAIIGLPHQTLYIEPGENIQSRLNALSASGGGVAILLPGVHDLADQVQVPSNVTLRGTSRWNTILRALIANWTGPVGTTRDGVVQVGTPDGLSPASDVTVEEIQVQCEVDLHGIAVIGGADIAVQNNVLKPLANIPTSHCAIVFTNGNGSRGRRFRCTGNLVTSDQPAAWFWTDGIHFDGGVVTGFTGIFGFPTNDRIYDSVCAFNIVEDQEETIFLFTHVWDSSIFVNRSRNCPYAATGIVVGMLECEEADLESNSFVDNPSGGNPICCYIYDSKECKAINNTLNAVQTAINTPFSIGFFVSGTALLGYTDGSVFTQNVLRNIALTGFQIAAGSTENHFGDNEFQNVGQPYADVNPAPNTNYYSSRTRRVGANPNGVQPGVFGECAYDPAALTWYKCTSYPYGTAWQVI